jgi:hypothetical protein
LEFRPKSLHRLSVIDFIAERKASGCGFRRKTQVLLKNLSVNDGRADK